MDYTSKLSSLNLERHVLGGILKHPDSFPDLDVFLCDKDFVNTTHSTIYLTIRRILLNGDKLDKVLLSEKVKSLGIRMDDNLDVSSYIENLSFSQINVQGLLDSARELIKLRVCRNICDSSDEIKQYVVKNKDKTVNEIIAQSDAIYNDKINALSTGENPADLFGDIETVIKHRAANPVTEVGIPTGFEIYNDMFGGLRVGVTATCGRAKSGKSTFLLNLAWGTILRNPEIKVLYLDTELKRDTNQFRAMAAFSQISCFHIESGLWAKNKTLADRMNKSWEQVNKLKGKLYHLYVGNKSAEELGSIVRRFYYNNCGRGNPAITILDYIKIGDEKLSNYNAEHQEIGRKINYLNELSNQLSMPIFSSCQLNRSALTDNRDDESAISMSDRLSWFGNGVYIFRKKRIEELTDEGGIEMGTHKLIPVVSRYHGKNTRGAFDLVKTQDHHGKSVYKQNFISYKLSEFLLEEVCTLKDFVDKGKFNKPLKDKTQPADDGSINL